MLYNNLLYFLVVIFVFSTNTPSAKPVLPPLVAFAAFVVTAWGFARIASRMYARAASGPTTYFSVEKKLSILAVLLFLGYVYLLDLKYYLGPLALGGRVPALVDIAGLGCFFLLLVLMWRAARHRYQQIFQRTYTSYAFVRSNFKANLPIVLPWLLLSLLFDGLRAVPLPGVTALFRPPWGDIALYVLFLLFLVVAFPPLVRSLWGCTPLPPGPLRDRLQAFCRTQGFYSEIYFWPLFEGQVLTAGIMGIVPKLRYLMITPALLEALSEDELDSVLAHEIGHVKHLHLVLYIVLFLGFSLFAGAAAKILPYLILSSDLFYRMLPHLPFAPENLLGVLATAPLLLTMVLYFRFVFGAFIRNFERQADAYVFRALGTGWPLIRSFEKIALLGGGNRDEKNWHHFGIGERIDFLARCERDRTLVARHDRKLRLGLVGYCLCIGLAIYGMSRIDVDMLAEGYETKYAEAVLLQKVRQEPDNGLWLLYLGDFLQSRKLERKAVDAYEKALQLTPTSPEINNNLAWLLLTAQDKALRNPERALVLARTALLLKERGFILDTLATAYWANGRIEEAVALERRAILLDPEHRAYYQGQIEKFRTQRWSDGR